MIDQIEQTCPSSKNHNITISILSVSYCLYSRGGGDEGGFQPTFRHPSLPTSQSFGNTGDETPDNGLTGTLVEYDCHQSVTKSNIITLTKNILKVKSPHSCKIPQVLVYVRFS